MSLFAPSAPRDSGDATRGDPPPLGTLLRERGLLTENELDRGLQEAHLSGRRIGEVLTAVGFVSDEDISEALAAQHGLGVADLDREAPEPGLVDLSDLDTYLSHRILPWRRIGTITTYATSDPARASEAIERLNGGSPFAFVNVATPAALNRALVAACGPALADRAATLLPARHSVRSLAGARCAFGVALVAGIAALLAGGVSPLLLLAVPMAVLSVATTMMRLAALIAGSRITGAQAATPVDTVRLSDKRPLPRITLLIPLYREAGMIRRIVSALERIDYPRSLLDVKLLLEESDEETITAVRASRLPPWIGHLVVPEGQPRTKPRALNFALDFCEGEIIGILDAEDRPAVDQLRAVAEHLRNAPPEVACVQCQLSYFNARENWITRCFQIEYSIWFDVLLRGFQRLGLPIPLGGTSVYMRRSALRAVGGWDAHNVTEDADLGMRLARHGLRCDVLASTTEEEANCRAGPWIRQRSRWLKGYLLTWLSHVRDPRTLRRELGTLGFLALNVLFLGGAVTYLAMPLFWAALASWALAGQSVFAGVLDSELVRLLGWALGIGQGVMLGCAALALWRRRALDLLISVPVLPFYWTLGALAAWKAVIEVMAAPYYWDKTRHGVTRMGGD